MKNIFQIIFIFILLSCNNNDELCQKLKEPIALDFKLGMTKKEYSSHRDELIKSKKIYPSLTGKIIEGHIDSSWTDHHYQSDYDYFEFSHQYYDPKDEDTRGAGFKIAIVPTFSVINGRLINLDLFPLPYNYPISSTRFLGITALIKVFEKKYGGNGSFNKGQVYKESEPYYYSQEWSCDNVKISFDSELTLFFDRLKAYDGSEFDRDVNGHLHSQEPVKVGFPTYFTKTIISYTDVRGMAEVTDKRYNDYQRSVEKKKKEVKDANKNQNSDF